MIRYRKRSGTRTTGSRKVRSPLYTAAMYEPSGIASAVRMTTKPKIVSQPVKVMALEPLSADEGVQQVDADDRRDDQSEEVSATHMRSIPQMSAIRMANMSTPRATATMSMPRSWRGGRQGPMQKPAGAIQIVGRWPRWADPREADRRAHRPKGRWRARLEEAGSRARRLT